MKPLISIVALEMHGHGMPCPYGGQAFVLHLLHFASAKQASNQGVCKNRENTIGLDSLADRRVAARKDFWFFVSSDKEQNIIVRLYRVSKSI